MPTWTCQLVPTNGLTLGLLVKGSFDHETAKLWMDNGVMFALSSLVVFALGLGVRLLYKWLNSKVPCKEVQYSEDWRAPGDLILHRLFGFLRLARSTTLKNLPISDAGRKLLFSDLLEIYFRTVAEHYDRWLKLNISSLHTMHVDVLASEQLSLLSAIVESIEFEFRRIGIPENVIDCFRRWHNPRIGHLRSEVLLICESEWLPEVSQRVGFILSVVEQVMKTTILDAEKTLNSLNGTLTGQTYHGVVLGPCKKREDSFRLEP